MQLKPRKEETEMQLKYNATENNFTKAINKRHGELQFKNEGLIPYSSC